LGKLREKLKAQALHDLETSQADLLYAANKASKQLGVRPQDLVRSLLPRSSSIEADLLRNIMDKIEDELVGDWKGFVGAIQEAGNNEKDKDYKSVA
jgi:hypothetical protein